jgi:hypothetical protein
MNKTLPEREAECDLLEVTHRASEMDALPTLPQEAKIPGT